MLAATTKRAGTALTAPPWHPGGESQMQAKGTERFKRERIDKNLFRRGDGRFEVKWVDESGVYRSRTVQAKNKTEALRERDKLMVKRHDGEVIVSCRKTFADVAGEYLASCDARVK